ncbi:hypothetical protein [Dendronalium sp. ChiSLP03b]|uniref:hypothetical protein n=1 Tax=Dendronalium sp. ChiSLP03b TaxID=3075381 RepID=UPI00391D87DE
MTDTPQPENLNDRLNTFDQKLDDLGDELDLIRTIQTGSRRELRNNSQTVARLERTVTQLAAIAHDHQLALQLLSQNAERDREQAQCDRQLFEARITQIWEYLLRQGGNGSGSDRT